jgi:hypothetical protein
VNKKVLSTLILLLCLFAMSSAALAQQPQRRRSGGLDNLSLPSRGVTTAAPTPYWQTLTPEGLGFSVMMPGRPEEESRDFGQGRIQMRIYRVKAEEMDYAAGVMLNFPPELMQQPGFAARYFQIMPEMLTASTDYKERRYKLISQSDVSVENHPGRQYKFDSAANTLTMRVYLGDRSIFIMIVESPKVSISNDNLEKFLSSFAFKEN